MISTLLFRPAGTSKIGSSSYSGAPGHQPPVPHHSYPPTRPPPGATPLPSRAASMAITPLKAQPVHSSQAPTDLPPAPPGPEPDRARRPVGTLRASRIWRRAGSDRSRTRTVMTRTCQLRMRKAAPVGVDSLGLGGRSRRRGRREGEERLVQEEEEDFDNVPVCFSAAFGSCIRCREEDV